MIQYRLEDLPAELRSRIKVHPVWGCWMWQQPGGGSPDEYATVGWQGGSYPVHRLAYALMVGAIPDGYTIDHVYARGCRIKSCCNPAHLEAVTQGVNSARRARASASQGVSRLIQQRIALGTATEEDKVYADAVWMLPFPVSDQKRGRRLNLGPLICAFCLKPDDPRFSCDDCADPDIRCATHYGRRRAGTCDRTCRGARAPGRRLLQGW